MLRGTPSGGGYDWDVIATEGAGDGQVNEPNGLALSPDGGTLLVADTSNNRILRFDAPGHDPPPIARLTVAIDQITRGAVSNETGIACATDCTQRYGAGRTVTLTATPVAGSTFAGWSGACAGATNGPTCTLAMNGPQSVGASFVATPPPPPLAAPLAPPPPPPPPPGCANDEREHRAVDAAPRAPRQPPPAPPGAPRDPRARELPALAPGAGHRDRRGRQARRAPRLGVRRAAAQAPPVRPRLHALRRHGPAGAS